MHWGVGGLSNLTPEMRDQLQAPRDLHGAVIETQVCSREVLPTTQDCNKNDIILEVDIAAKSKAQATCRKPCPRVAKGQDALLLV